MQLAAERRQVAYTLLSTLPPSLLGVVLLVLQIIGPFIHLNANSLATPNGAALIAGAILALSLPAASIGTAIARTRNERYRAAAREAELLKARLEVTESRLDALERRAYREPR